MTDRKYDRVAARLGRKEARAGVRYLKSRDRHTRAGARFRRSLEKLAAQWEKIGGGDDE